MCDKEPLEELYRIFGGFYRERKKGKEGWKRRFTWKLSSRKAEPVIRELLPYLKIKRKQDAAQACLDFLAIPVTYAKKNRVTVETLKARDACYKRTRKANKRGSNSS